MVTKQGTVNRKSSVISVTVVTTFRFAKIRGQVRAPVDRGPVVVIPRQEEDLHLREEELCLPEVDLRRPEEELC